MDPAHRHTYCCGDWSWTQPIHILTVVETGDGPSPSTYLLLWRLVVDPACPHTYCCGDWSWTQSIHIFTVVETGHGPIPSTYLQLWRLVIDPARPHTYICGDWSWTQPIHILTVVDTDHGHMIQGGQLSVYCYLRKYVHLVLINCSGGQLSHDLNSAH